MAIQELNNGESGLTIRTKINANFKQRFEKVEISPDLDNVVTLKETTPLQLNVKFFQGVTSATYRAKLDDGTDTYTSYADLTALNVWLDGLSVDVDVDIEITTNPTEVTFIELELDKS